jgi:hypothetical protein
MKQAQRPPFSYRTLDELTINDEPSFRHIPLYADLKQVLQQAAYPFRVLPSAYAKRADRALLLNLTFWHADAGGDLLCDAVIEADVVAHAAWHHVAARALAPGRAGRMAKASVEALFLGEAVASAFDVYMVGCLLGQTRRSSFLETQVPAMAEAADAAGMTEQGFEQLLQSIAADPDRAFVELRALLYDATSALFACESAEQAHAALHALGRHRFSALLHRYELSNWVLYARAFGSPRADARARAVDAALRKRKRAVKWLADEWVRPLLKSE